MINVTGITEKGLSKAVNRRTDNVMVKRKKTKGQTMVYKTLHRKLIIEQQRPYKTSGVIQNKSGICDSEKKKNLGAKSSQCNTNK